MTRRAGGWRRAHRAGGRSEPGPPGRRGGRPPASRRRGSPPGHRRSWPSGGRSPEESIAGLDRGLRDVASWPPTRADRAPRACVPSVSTLSPRAVRSASIASSRAVTRASSTPVSSGRAAGRTPPGDAVTRPAPPSAIATTMSSQATAAPNRRSGSARSRRDLTRAPGPSGRASSSRGIPGPPPWVVAGTRRSTRRGPSGRCYRASVGGAGRWRQGTAARSPRTCLPPDRMSGTGIGRMGRRLSSAPRTSAVISRYVQ